MQYDELDKLLSLIHIYDDLSVIGSFNMDMRSAYLDTELMLVIRSKDIWQH